MTSDSGTDYSEHLLPVTCSVSYSSLHLHYLQVHNSLQSNDMQSSFPAIIITTH